MKRFPTAFVVPAAIAAALGFARASHAVPVSSVFTSDDPNITHSTVANLTGLIIGTSVYDSSTLVDPNFVISTNETELYGGVATTPPFPGSTNEALSGLDLVTGKANNINAQVLFFAPVTSTSDLPDVALFDVAAGTQTDLWTITPIVLGPGGPELGGTPFAFNQNTQFGDTGHNINFRRNESENLTQDLVGAAFDVTQLGLAQGSTIIGVQVVSAGGDPSVIVGLQDALAVGLAPYEQFRVAQSGGGANPAAGEYNTGSITGQNPIVAGYAGPWTGDTTGAWQVVQTGLDAHVLGGEVRGSVQYQSDVESGFHTVSRDTSAAISLGDGQSIYMSMLVQLNANDPDFDGSAVAGFTANDNPTSGGTQGFRVGVAGDGSEMDLVYRSRTRLVPPAGAVTLEDNVILDGVQPGQTHLVVVKGTKNVSGLPGGFPNDEIHIWLDPDDVSSEAALGAPDLVVFDFSLFNANDFQLLTLQGANLTGAGVRFDEIRYGLTFDDVIEPGIPEPATGVLSLIGLAALIRRRRAA